MRWIGPTPSSERGLHAAAVQLETLDAGRRVVDQHDRALHLVALDAIRRIRELVAGDHANAIVPFRQVRGLPGVGFLGELLSGLQHVEPVGGARPAGTARGSAARPCRGCRPSSSARRSVSGFLSIGPPDCARPVGRGVRSSALLRLLRAGAGFDLGQHRAQVVGEKRDRRARPARPRDPGSSARAPGGNAPAGSRPAPGATIGLLQALQASSGSLVLPVRVEISTAPVESQVMRPKRARRPASSTLLVHTASGAADAAHRMQHRRIARGDEALLAASSRAR